MPILTTGGPAPAGVYWQAAVLRKLVLDVAPHVGISAEAPKRGLNLALTPGIGVRPPSSFSLRLNPTIGMRGGVQGLGSVNLHLDPTIKLALAKDASLNLALSAHIDLAGTPRDVENGSFLASLTPAIHTGTPTVRNPVVVDQVGYSGGLGGASFSFSATAGAYVVIDVASDRNSVPTASYGSYTLTLVTTQALASATGGYIRRYVYAGAPGGAVTVSGSASSAWMSVSARSYLNVGSATQVTSTSGRAGTLSLPASCVDGQIICGTFAASGGGGPVSGIATPTGGTQRFNYVNTGSALVGIDSSASTTFSSTAGSDYWAGIASVLSSS